MALTEKQLARRSRSLGGSDIATILGHDYRSSYDLWLAKKHGVEPFAGNDATQFGQVVEGAIADWAAGELGVRIRKNVFRAARGLPFHANLDAMVLGKAEALEVKMTGRTDEWGEPGTDDVPHRVQCQVQWQAGIAGLDRVHIAAGFVPGLGQQKLRMFHADRHDDLINFMFDQGRDWWTRYIEGDEIPSDLPSANAIKAIERVPNFERVIDRDLVAELLQAKSEKRDIEAHVQELTKQLHKALYDPETENWAEVGVVGDSRVTYFEYRRKDGKSYRRLNLPKEI